MPRREITGKVVSDKMDKTIVVAVESRHPHPRYGKIIKSTNKFKAHDEANSAHTGDIVKIVESRPLSKDKRWSLLEVVERAQ
ncbi:30S ribosomal protein S17 [compost metagenome]|jgi:small subunit ribosomal protein S17